MTYLKLVAHITGESTDFCEGLECRAPLPVETEAIAQRKRDDVGSPHSSIRSALASTRLVQWWWPVPSGPRRERAVLDEAIARARVLEQHLMRPRLTRHAEDGELIGVVEFAPKNLLGESIDQMLARLETETV